VTLEPPELVRVTYCAWLLATWMVPKFILEGLAVRYAAVAAVAESEFDAVPERRIVVLLERCLPLLPMPVQLTTDTLPVALPLVCGENITDKLALPCGSRVIGKPGPAKLNPIPVTVACEMVRFDLPLLLTAINNVRLLPVWTLPKFTLEEEKASWPVAALE